MFHFLSPNLDLNKALGFGIWLLSSFLLVACVGALGYTRFQPCHELEGSEPLTSELCLYCGFIDEFIMERKMETNEQV